MKVLISIFLFFTMSVISQNSDSDLVTGIYEEMDKHYSSLDVKCNDNLRYRVVNDTCECQINTITDLVFNLEKDDEWIIKKDSTKKFLDEYMLNEFFYYELPKEFTLSEIKFLKKLDIKFKSVCIDINIKRIKIRYNPIIMNKQVIYRITVTYLFTPFG